MNPPNLRLLAVCCAVCTFLNPSLRANGARLPSLSPWVVARGHAAVASVDSAAAAWFNPAGLAQIPGGELRLEPSVLFTDVTFRSASGREVGEQSDPFFIPAAFAAHRLTDRVVLGIGVVSPFGLSTEWPSDSGFAEIATFNEVSFVTSLVSVGWKVTRQLAVGASLEFSDASIDLNRLQPLGPGAATSFSYRARANAGSGNIGVQWQIDQRSAVGAHYQLPTVLHLDGTATLAGLMSQPGTSKWTFADHFDIGYRIRFATDWEAEVSVDWTFWDRTGALDLAAGPLSTSLPLHWKTSRYYNLGLEHRLNARWRVAAGYSYSENSIPDATLSPALPDTDRHLLDAGVEYARGRWQVQLITERGIGEDRPLRGPGGSTLGVFENDYWFVAASVAYRL